MNNGRMTFRFDTDKDKGGLEPQDIQSGAGGLGTAKDYTRRVPDRGDADPVEAWPYSPSPDDGEQERYERYKDYDLEPQDSRQGEWEDLSRNPGSSPPAFFRSGPATDLWERTPRRIPPVIQEEYRYSGQYPELTPANEPEDIGDISYSGVSYGGSYQSRRPTHWWKFALSIAGALGTGLLLGYAALSFISGVNDSGSGTGGTNTPSVQTGAGTAVQPVAGDTGLPVTGAGSGAGRIPVAVAEQNYYLLQYGVFSTAAGARQAKQELLAAGLAAGSDPEGGNRVYAGVSPDREQAKLLSSGLKNQGIELYVREVTLPAAQQAEFSGSSEAVNRYFAASGNLLKELSSLSASLLSGTGGTADTAAVSDLHMQWTEAVKSLEPGLTAEGQNLCTGLEKSMSQGIAALNEYSKNQAQGLLWEVQESMMSFLAGQKSLLSLLD